MLPRGQVREDWNWLLDRAVNLGEVKCSFDRVVKANPEWGGFKKWCQVFKGFSVMRKRNLAVAEDENGIKRWGSLLGELTTCLWDQRNSPQREENLWYSRWRWGWFEPHVLDCWYNKWPKICALKQQQCISLHILKSEIQNAIQWAKVTVPAGQHSYLEVVGENLFPCLIQLLENRSYVVGRGCLLRPEHSLEKILLALALLHLYSKAKLAC